MTRDEHKRAAKLADALVAALDGNPLQDMAHKLRRLIDVPPTMEEILLRVPGDSHTARAATIGLSRAGYYALLAGTSRPTLLTAKRLADLTGIPEEVIRTV